MTSAELTALLRAATTGALAARGIDADVALPGIDWAAAAAPRVITREPAAERGCYASAVALKVAGVCRVPASELAERVAARLAEHPDVAGAQAAGAGFVNFRLGSASKAAVIGKLLDGAGEPPEPVDQVPVDQEPVDQGLAEAVGVDAARYALHRSPVITDTGLLTRYTEENPVYRVRYTHARLAALARHAQALKITPGDRFELLEHPAEDALTAALAELPGLARTGPKITRYLERLAGLVAEFERHCPALPKGDEPISEQHRARVALGAAARRVMADGLGLLGVSAPERM